MGDGGELPLVVGDRGLFVVEEGGGRLGRLALDRGASRFHL